MERRLLSNLLESRLWTGRRAEVAPDYFRLCGMWGVRVPLCRDS